VSTPPRQQPPHRLPVLTEVVPTERDAGIPLGEVADAAPSFAPTAPAALPPPPPPPVSQVARPAAAATMPRSVPPAAPAAAPINEELVVQRVLMDVQRQLDLVFEYRLREMLAPTLARIADSLIRDTRNELATTLREIVSRAVAQELQRQRGR
jgi:hypothetical protein